MKNMVLVPVFQPDIPWASQPISFPYECVHVDLVLWFETRWRYSKSSPLSPTTKFAISQNQFKGILRADICWGFTVYVVPVSLGVAAKFRIPRLTDSTYLGLYTFTHVSIAYCMMLVDVNLVLRLAAGGLSFSSWEM